MQPSCHFFSSFRRRLAMVCGAAAVLLAGCQAPPSRQTAPPPPPVVIAIPVPAENPAPTPPRETPPATDPVLQVLARTDALLRLAPPELGKEIARLGESEDAAVENPFLLAMALAQTRQPVDTARALGLVQRLLANNAAAAQPLHPLARLLEARLLQQRRLEDQLDKQNQQLRDLQRRNDQLNERLEAVRAIERSLTTRPAPPPAPPASAPGSSPQRPAP